MADEPIDRDAETEFQAPDVVPAAYAETTDELGRVDGSAPTVRRSAPAGGQAQRIGPYVVEKELGRGGMGVVYLARHEQTGGQVALKLLLGEGSASFKQRDRFVREGEAAERLDHPGIVKVSGRGTTADGKLYLAMDYVQGPTLHKILPQVSMEDLLFIVAKVARAMGHAHEQNVIHRDLKPANILVRESDGQPVVTDFGLARDLDRSSLTKTGTIMGTPMYLAPEQAEDSKRVGATADVYALGSILYEGLTGRPPYGHVRGSSLQLLKAILSDPITPPSQTNHRVPQRLEAICMKALAREPAERYPNGTAMAAAIEEAQAELFGQTGDLTPVVPMLESLKQSDPNRETLRPDYVQPSTLFARMRSGVMSSLGIVLLSTSFCCGFPWGICMWWGPYERDAARASYFASAQVLSPEEAVGAEGVVCLEDVIADVESQVVVEGIDCLLIETEVFQEEETHGPSKVPVYELRGAQSSRRARFSFGPLKVREADLEVAGWMERLPEIRDDGFKTEHRVLRAGREMTVIGVVKDGVLCGLSKKKPLLAVSGGGTREQWVEHYRSEGFTGFLRWLLLVGGVGFFLAALIAFALRGRPVPNLPASSGA